MKYKNSLIIVLLAVLVVGVPVVDAVAYQDQIYPGVKAGSIEIGGSTEDEARLLLRDKFDAFRSKEATFVLDKTQTTLRRGSLVDIDVEQTIARAKDASRGDNALKNLKFRIASRAKGVTVEPVISVHTETLTALLNDAFRATQQFAEDASFTFTLIGNKPPIVSIQPGRPGAIINALSAASDLSAQSKTLSNAPITLTTEQSPPAIVAANLDPLLPKIEKLLAEPINISAEGRKWQIPTPTLSSWIKPARNGDNVELDFDLTKIVAWLDRIIPTVEQNPTDALFELTPDQKKVIQFKPGKSGIQIPRDENAAKIAVALAEGVREIELLRSTIPPQISTAHGAELYGIKTLLGRATTNFKGSPPNRVKNIARGAEILYGELIAPDEEFSLLEHLRPFTLENGYLSELVIKAAEGRTVPEIGGGLCQIGTTLFRTTLGAGLPILARRNHSYRVSYYEPPVGMDATIYDPWPDYKFKNDTGHWLLLTSYINTKSTEITFELWGTADGRKAETTEPEVFNFRSPPPAKIIETADLPPGVKKCTERAHIGSDAKFTYKVTYADGTVKEEEFKSRYRPWQEVCLLGVEPRVGEETDTAAGQALPDTLPSADTLGVVGE